VNLSDWNAEQATVIFLAGAAAMYTVIRMAQAARASGLSWPPRSMRRPPSREERHARVKARLWELYPNGIPDDPWEFWLTFREVCDRAEIFPDSRDTLRRDVIRESEERRKR